MQKQQVLRNTVSLVPGIDGDIQVVHATGGMILIDVQGAHRGTDGHLYHNHGFVRMTPDALVELRSLIDQLIPCIEAENPKQAKLWSVPA